MANFDGLSHSARRSGASEQSPSDILAQGCVIPAHPLALTAERKLDERRQRALSRYYLAAGAGGLAVGVHTTQFTIHDPRVGLLRPVLTLAAEEMDRGEAEYGQPLVRVTGICGDTPQAIREAQLARDLGYQFGLLNLASSGLTSTRDQLAHARNVGETIDLFGFYLQPAVGGIDLPLEFWRGFCELPSVRAIKIAAFDRYKTLMVVRAVAESQREDISLYTGNDDNIIVDLLTSYRFQIGDRHTQRNFVGGLLGQWAVWTAKAVVIHRRCREVVLAGQAVPADLLRLSAELTDANAAIFDAEHGFQGCVPGIHDILRRQGLLAGCWCLDEHEVLSERQALENERICRAYPHLTDDEFVAQHRDAWLSG